MEDPILDVDPECDKSPVLPDGSTWTFAEHSAHIISIEKVQPREGSKGREFIDIAVLIPNTDIGGVFVHTQMFGPCHTATAKNSRSSWKQFAGNLGIEGMRASEAKDLPVTVTVGINSYVAREDRLSQEQMDAGETPKKTERNYIKNIVAE